MNKLSKIVIGLLMLATLAACSKVPVGNVGVKVYLLGGSKGVDVEELSPGRYWIGINEELYLFPTFTQNYTWTKAPDETGNEDESISFQTVEGLTVNADMGISYSIRPDKVSAIFQKYRKGINEITDVYLRNMVRDALVTVASTRPIETVYGAGKADLISGTESMVRKQVEPLGITIERLYWAGDLRLPPNVTASINAKIQATQMAQQRLNEVEQAKAEAEKVRQTASGEADGKLIIATAEAKAIRIKADALAQNAKLVEWSAIEKWDGHMPQITGGSVPFVNIPGTK
jgi:regulator of protease activity HflC (stomatin/prohibitin superfamily)